MNVLETYSVVDCIYYDPVTSDTTSKYYWNSSGGTSVSYADDYLTLTLGSSGQYARVKTSEYIVSDFVGKKVHFEAELITNAGTAFVQVYDDYTGTLYSRASGDVVSDGVSEVEYTFPSNVTQILFQIAPKSGMGNGDTIKIKNVKVYFV